MLTNAMKLALKTLEVNGTSTKNSSAMRALVRRGLVIEEVRFEAPSIFRITPREPQLLVSPAGEEPYTTTLREFVGANQEDAGTVGMVNTLRVGEGFTVGGGAAPAVEIKRVQ